MPGILIVENHLLSEWLQENIMEFSNLHLLSTYLKKWSYNDNKITLNYSFCFEDQYERNRIEMRIGSPVNLLNEFLNHVFHRAKERIHEIATENNEDVSNANNIILINESEVKRKLSVFLSKIVKEFNQNKRSRGKSRMISTRSLDFYYNDFEFEPLEDSIKYFVHYNRGINKMNGDLWSNAIDDMKLALELRPDSVQANKNIATAYNKIGRFAEAVDHLKICADKEDSADSLNALANAYIHLENFKKAESIYNQLNDRFPGTILAQFGMAQLAFKLGKKYKTILDKIYKEDPDWLREKLRSSWEYKIPGYCDHEECMWNAAIAARYLGFERPFDLTRKAFNEEVPSYFDSDKGTIRFVREELDHWVELMNRYNVDGSEYQIYEDRLSKAEIDKANLRPAKKQGRSKTKSTKKKTKNIELT